MHREEIKLAFRIWINETNINLFKQIARKLINILIIYICSKLIL